MDTAAVMIRNLNLSYQDGLVVDDLTLGLNPQELGCLLGPSGCGKSTLLRAIAGFQELDSGEIWLDNQLLSTERHRVPPEDRGVGMVFQDIALFPHLTVAENIAFGLDKRYIDFSLVRKVSKIVELDDFIMSRPQKYNLLIGEKGVKLSGGQLQRIGLARALYKNSEIIFLDEATSALDNKTERKIIESIKYLDKNITIIMIAHRLSSLKSCNKILEIKDGKVIRNLEGNNLNLIN